MCLNLPTGASRIFDLIILNSHFEEQPEWRLIRASLISDKSFSRKGTIPLGNMRCVWPHFFRK